MHIPAFLNIPSNFDFFPTKTHIFFTGMSAKKESFFIWTAPHAIQKKRFGRKNTFEKSLNFFILITESFNEENENIFAYSCVPDFFDVEKTATFLGHMKKVFSPPLIYNNVYI